MKYKVGDIIQIQSEKYLKSLPFYDKRTNMVMADSNFTRMMWHLCDQRFIIKNIVTKNYEIYDHVGCIWIINHWMIKDNIDDKGNFLLEL